MENLEDWKKAGKLTAEALEFGKKLIKPDASILDVTEQIEKFILGKNADLAFPVNISMNDTAAHDCARINDERKFKDEVVKLDIGVHVEGFIGDSALTVDLSGKNSELVKASRDALDNALKIMTPGNTLAKVGKTIQETIESYGFQPVRNLSGHLIGQFLLHAGLNLPNFDSGEDVELEEDMVFAVEPFATNGVGLIKETSNPQIFSMADFKPQRIQFVKVISKYIENRFAALPFSKRMLFEHFSEAQITMALNTFDRLDIMKKYTPLVEKQQGLVSQAEHTVVVKDKPIVLTKI